MPFPCECVCVLIEECQRGSAPPGEGDVIADSGRLPVSSAATVSLFFLSYLFTQSLIIVFL